MLSRVAESMYWMSRYIERAENVARFADVNWHLILDSSTNENEQWMALVDTTGDQEEFTERLGKATRSNVINFLTVDTENLNSILSCVRAARENARTVRDAISSEMWEQINTFYLMLNDAAAVNKALESPYEFFNQVRLASHLFVGITDTTMSHNEGWNFCRMGQHLERTDKTSRILDVKYFSPGAEVDADADTEADAKPETQTQSQSQSQTQTESDAETGADEIASLDDIQWAAVLKSASALEMYRKRHRQILPDRVVEFLLLDREFPRAALKCVNTADEALHAITGTPRGAHESIAERRLGLLCSELGYADVHEILAQGLHMYVDTLQVKLNSVGEGIAETFFGVKRP